MNLIILGVAIITICIIVLCKIRKVKHIKKEKAILIYGIVNAVEEISGRPNRYKLEVDVTNNGVKSKKTIVTFDKRCWKYHIGDNIPLIYHSEKDEYYWQEDKAGILSFLKIFCWVLIVFSLCIILIGIAAF